MAGIWAEIAALEHLAIPIDPRMPSRSVTPRRVAKDRIPLFHPALQAKEEARAASIACAPGD